MIEYDYRGLPDHGIALIAPDSPRFAGLAREVATHADPADAPWLESLPSTALECAAILVNLAEKPIISLAWRWRIAGDDASLQPGCAVRLAADAWLVPLGGPPPDRSYIYRSAIFPNSRRLIVSKELIGSNRDVRPPEPHEVFTGAGFGSRRSTMPANVGVRKVALEIDGVFFDDGEFIGPNELGLWEIIWCEAEVVGEASRVARGSRDAGRDAEEILIEVERFTGPPWPRRDRHPPPPHLHVDVESQKEFEKAHVADLLDWRRTHRGAQDAADALCSWPDQTRPNLRRSK